MLRDDEIPVLDVPRDDGGSQLALPLAECWAELKTQIQRSWDKNHVEAATARDKRRWEVSVRSGDEAAKRIREAIERQELPIWCVVEGKETMLHVTSLELRNVKAGVYSPLSGPNGQPRARGRQGVLMWAKRADWRRFLAGITGADLSPKLKRGRPKGSGSLAHDDAPLIVEMSALIRSGKARSRTKAAQLVADRAKGHGTYESKVSRLVKGFNETEKNL